jgi:hypothetical protein
MLVLDILAHTKVNTTYRRTHNSESIQSAFTGCTYPHNRTIATDIWLTAIIHTVAYNFYCLAAEYSLINK